MTALASFLRSPFSRLVLGAALAVSLVGAGCATVVTGGGDDSGGGAGGSSTTGDSSSSSEPGHPTDGGASTAIAMLRSEIPPLDPASGSSGSSGTTGGGDIDPNTLYVMLGDEAIACSAPYAAQGCGSHWRVTIGIPPWLQAPGIIDLASPEVISGFSATGPGGGDDCYFAGGSFIDGTLEIVSIDDDQITGVLTNTTHWEFNADGPFTASRCF